ncbi:MAG: hypothetical protein OXM01_08795 [Gemmatimonadota bacterium]|nr:hypothetical protein [Gemmatimonadota bacterium]
MNLDSFDIGEIVAQRWFQIAHGVAIIATLAMPWAIMDDHSDPASAFVLIYRLMVEVDHSTGSIGIAWALIVAIILASAIHFYIKLGGGRGLWPAWVITIAALLLPLLSSDAVTGWWGYAATLLLSAPPPVIWCVNKARNPRLGASWTKLKGAMGRGNRQP